MSPEGADGAALWTDLYAVSAIGYLILTGKDKSEGTKDQWEAELKSSAIPPEIRRIVLKGLREKDTTKTEDPTLYPSAEHLANDISKWREGLVRRERRIRQTLVTALLLFIVAAIGFVGWQRYYKAIASSDLKVWQSLQAEIREQANLSHPAVAQLLAEEKSLIIKRDDADTRQDRAASRDATTQLLAKSREVLSVARDIDRAEHQRIAIGKLLLEDEATEKSGFWVTQAPAIQARLAELQRHYHSIADRVRSGKTGKLPDDLAQMQTELAELFKVNIEARSAYDARLIYDRLLLDVPARLRTNDGFLTILSGAEQAEKSWAVTDWDGGHSLTLARQQFGVATQQLDEWLPRNLAPEELEKLESDSQSRVAELTTEVKTLRTTINTQTAKTNELNQQIVDLNKERIEDRTTLSASIAELKSEKSARLIAEQRVNDMGNVETERADLRMRLAKVTPELESAQSTLKSTQKALTKAERDRDKYQQDAARWKKLSTDAPGVSTATASQLNALDAEVGQADSNKHEEVLAAFAKAATTYQTIEKEKADLVRPDAYENNHPLVKAKDSELSHAAEILTSALKKLDAADQSMHETIEKQIIVRRKLYNQKRSLGMAEKHPDLLKIVNEIAELQTQMGRYSNGHSRSIGNACVRDILEVIRISNDLTEERQKAVELVTGKSHGERRTIHLPGGSTIRLVYIPPSGTSFLMGSPRSETGRDDDEAQVEVSITKGYWIAETELTQSQWTAVMGENSTPWHGKAFVEEGPDFPATYISHGTNSNGSVQPQSAAEYCRRLTQYEQKAGHLPSEWRFDLPTEAQWEYSCRAGTTTPYSFSGDDSLLEVYSWYKQNGEEVGEEHAHEVHEKGANSWGPYDMHGNLYEWCRDGLGKDLLSGDDPFRAAGWTDLRVLRGGSWNYGASSSRSASRFGLKSNSRESYVGFRVSMTQR